MESTSVVSNSTSRATFNRLAFMMKINLAQINHFHHSNPPHLFGNWWVTLDPLQAVEGWRTRWWRLPANDPYKIFSHHDNRLIKYNSTHQTNNPSYFINTNLTQHGFFQRRQQPDLWGRWPAQRAPVWDPRSQEGEPFSRGQGEQPQGFGFQYVIPSLTLLFSTDHAQRMSEVSPIS